MDGSPPGAPPPHAKRSRPEGEGSPEEPPEEGDGRPLRAEGGGSPSAKRSRREEGDEEGEERPDEEGRRESERVARGRGRGGRGKPQGRKSRVREAERAVGTGPVAGWLGHRVCVVTCDGRTLVGKLVGCDGGVNLVLKGCEERLYSPDEGVKVVDLGLYVLRGTTVAVVGEVDAGAEAAVDFKAQRAPPIPPIDFGVGPRSGTFPP